MPSSASRACHVSSPKLPPFRATLGAATAAGPAAVRHKPPRPPASRRSTRSAVQVRPAMATCRQRVQRAAARCRFWLICDLAGFGFVNLFGPLLNQKLGGFASCYFTALWGVGGGGPRRKNPEISTTPRLDSPIANFAASYSMYICTYVYMYVNV